jgi:glyoxylase-like metal-dependent hydrolase (beta-lactamase superfamily II)
MKVQKIGTRGLVFTFFELDNCPTNVFVVHGRTHTFVCDTFLGPHPMEKIINYVAHENNQFIIFNSHSHWDHIWGNCAFESLIISHRACREIIIQEGESELEQYRKYTQGDVKIVLPTVTFTESISFPDEGIHLFYTPGHTRDSASCLDCVDNTLFVGDNVEAPIPYLDYDDLTVYTYTLQTYLTMNPDTIIPGHGNIADKSLVQENLEYVDAFMQNNTEKYEEEFYQPIHQINVKTQKNYV